MARVQLALNVDDIDAAVDFYGRLFATEPHKRRPGYANFEVADPPLKLVLFEHAGAERLNHLGVEVATPAEVTATRARLDETGLAPTSEEGTCCFAEQTKVWVDDGGKEVWEIYSIVDDDPDQLGLLPDESDMAKAGGAGCCT